LRTIPDAQFAGFYFRPENSWPSRLVRTVNSEYRSHLISLSTRQYLICWPQNQTFTSSSRGRVEMCTQRDFNEVADWTKSVIDPVRAASLGFDLPRNRASIIGEEFNRANLCRQRHIFSARRDKALAGIALSYSSDVPMNLSFLCNRVEIFIHPESPDR